MPDIIVLSLGGIPVFAILVPLFMIPMYFWVRAERKKGVMAMQIALDEIKQITTRDKTPPPTFNEEGNISSQLPES